MKATPSTGSRETVEKATQLPVGSKQANLRVTNQIRQLQRTIGNRAVMQLLNAHLSLAPVMQKKIDHDGDVFITDGSRPGWRQFLKKSTAKEVNVSVKTNFTSLDLDRAHRIPFAAIEQLVCDYCNQEAAADEFEELTDALYDEGGEYDTMVKTRTQLIHLIDDEDSVTNIKKKANQLLSILNSATKNVSPGNFSENRGIQDRPDYGYVSSPGGTSYNLSPRSRDIHDAWSAWSREPAIPMSPGGEHVRSSQISSEQYQGTAVPYNQINWDEDSI